MSYFTYILYSEALDRYYVGATKAVSTRLEKHLWNHGGFTSKAKDWILKHTEEYDTKTEAYLRERQIKKWKSRKLIKKLISS